jgi:hypothetical protein
MNADKKNLKVAQADHVTLMAFAARRALPVLSKFTTAVSKDVFPICVHLCPSVVEQFA